MTYIPCRLANAPPGGLQVDVAYWIGPGNERTTQQYYNGGSLWAPGADAAYQPAANAGVSVIDHDACTFGSNTYQFNTNYTGSALYLSVTQHIWFARQSTLSARSLNRIYAGFHTADGLLPGSMVKLIRWEDCGNGPRTHIYCGDGYLAPHALYHLVNPHRFHRTDDLRRWQSVETLDLRKL